MYNLYISINRTWKKKDKGDEIEKPGKLEVRCGRKGREEEGGEEEEEQRGAVHGAP